MEQSLQLSSAQPWAFQKTSLQTDQPAHFNQTLTIPKAESVAQLNASHTAVHKVPLVDYFNLVQSETLVEEPLPNFLNFSPSSALLNDSKLGLPVSHQPTFWNESKPAFPNENQATLTIVQQASLPNEKHLILSNASQLVLHNNSNKLQQHIISTCPHYIILVN